MNNQEWNAAANRLRRQLLNARRDLQIGRPNIATKRGAKKFSGDFAETLQTLKIYANSEDKSARLRELEELRDQFGKKLFLNKLRGNG